MLSEDSFAVPEMLRRTVEKFSQREGVKGILVCDKEGLTLQSNLPTTDAETISAHVASLVTKVYRVAEAIGKGELSSIFIEMMQHEVLLTPDPESGFTIVVLKEKSTS